VEDRDILERVDVDLDAHVETIAREFRDGFEAVEQIGGPGVTIYGSARIGPRHPVYGQAREVGRRFAELTDGGRRRMFVQRFIDHVDGTRIWTETVYHAHELLFEVAYSFD